MVVLPLGVKVVGTELVAVLPSVAQVEAVPIERAGAVVGMVAAIIPAHAHI